MQTVVCVTVSRGRATQRRRLVRRLDRLPRELSRARSAVGDLPNEPTETGFVFISGRDVAPPYRVSVDEDGIRINGFCRLCRLLRTGRQEKHEHGQDADEC